MIYNTTHHVIEKSHSGDAGFDLKSEGNHRIYPYSSAVISTGVRVKIPEGYYGMICGRSGLAFKHNVIPFYGIIDSSYTGEIKVKLWFIPNLKQLWKVIKEEKRVPYFKINDGDRIAQIVINKMLGCNEAELVSIQELEEIDSERSDKGFGSTGN